MTTKTKQKLLTYGVALIFFGVGVLAVLRWSGEQREVGFAVSMIGLLAVAVIQTIRIKKNNRR